MSALNFMASNGFIAIDTSNFVYKIADLVSGTSFTFLQILIGFSAAKRSAPTRISVRLWAWRSSTRACKTLIPWHRRASRPWCPSFPAPMGLTGSGIRAM